MHHSLGLCLLVLTIGTMGVQRGGRTAHLRHRRQSRNDLGGLGERQHGRSRRRRGPRSRAGEGAAHSLAGQGLDERRPRPLHRLGPGADSRPHLHRGARGSRWRRRSRRPDEQRHAGQETRLPERWQGPIYGRRHVGRGQVVHAERRGRGSERRLKTRRHRGQPSRSELRLPQSGRRPLRRRLHRDSGGVRHEYRPGRFRQGRIHRSGRPEPRRRTESNLFQRRQSGFRQDPPVRPGECRGAGRQLPRISTATERSISRSATRRQSRWWSI